ncbi:hypothetical protein ARMGADRAFT_1016586 [Armillaria gallica]|uniref:Uncharacterized protein n=1 Tax=Armillaria gallica TaxID=47427 RepID=A0A2H3D105_ARMGA|nr:hypothetical protein ARMGADRAFT_1016586 [Armillaria gallica]
MMHNQERGKDQTSKGRTLSSRIVPTPASRPAHPQRGGPHSTQPNGFRLVWRGNINVPHWGSTP